MDFSVFNIFCGICGLLAAITLTYHFFFLSKKSFPWLLWYLWIFCYFPFVYVVSICSLVQSILQFLEVYDDITIQIPLLSLLAFGEQQIRAAFVLTIIDRLLATVLLESYTKSTCNWLLVAVLSMITYFVSFLYTFCAIFVHFDPVVKKIGMTAVILWIHGLAIIGCKLLQVKNFNMYKLLAYRITLQKRHLILQNFRSLSLMWFSVVILSTVGPLGPLGRLAYYLITGIQASANAQYLSYNIAVIMLNMKFIMIVKKHKKAATVKPITAITPPTAVVGPLGNQLPLNVTTDIYFKNLKSQWN